MQTRFTQDLVVWTTQNLNVVAGKTLTRTGLRACLMERRFARTETAEKAWTHWPVVRTINCPPYSSCMRNRKQDTAQRCCTWCYRWISRCPTCRTAPPMLRTVVKTVNRTSAHCAKQTWQTSSTFGCCSPANICGAKYGLPKSRSQIVQQTKLSSFFYGAVWSAAMFEKCDRNLTLI